MVESSNQLSLTNLEFARRKYREERDKRRRPDAEDQYIQVEGKFARYYEDDPYARDVNPREPVADEIEVAIIGGGFSGLLTAVRLSEAGIDDFRIVEAAADFGGTWYWNRYPGAQCDIESYCYLPLLEEVGYIPKEKYSYAEEIFEHTRRIGERYNLYPRTYFQTRVRELRWREDIGRWLITTNRQDTIKARFVVVAVGTASRAKLPGIPGIEEFAGCNFHTSRWDYEFTGGDAHGGMNKLGDKNVAVIGTGATAVQCVPYLAQDAKHLFVFQRTPSSVDVRGNKPTDAEWAKALRPNWQSARQENFATVVGGHPFTEDLVSDAWTDVFRNLLSGPRDPDIAPEEMARRVELADLEKMNHIRARVDRFVSDPRVAELLKPWYRQFCKRPTFNDEYLPAFNRPNVTLVDTSPSRGVERITKSGVIANGREYQVDCLIFATGFEVSATDFRKRIGFEIFGEDGVSLYDHWQNGVVSLHGHSTSKFPNWFYIGRGQNALCPNMTHMFDQQTRHVAYIIAEVTKLRARVVEVIPEFERKWADLVHSLAVDNQDFLEACTPGYYNNEGMLKGGVFAEVYSPGIVSFGKILSEWRSEGKLEGLELR